MNVLYEYGKWARTSQPTILKRFLRDLWSEHLFIEPDEELSEDQQDTRYQPFLRFDGEQIRANNFVGFIQNENELIEIFPKVFRDVAEAEEKKALMLQHIFYWFEYCRKWRFPFTQSTLDAIECDKFPELIINLIANQFLEAVSNRPLSLYQPIEEALQRPKGSINFKRYISNGLTRGNLHILDCDHEPFLFDNRINRIIKYCLRLLLNQTKIAENLNILQATLFILDEVEDVTFSVNDLDSISINTFFGDYVPIIESCRMILAQQLYSSCLGDLSQWCLLFPMEYIFEDFTAGFLARKFQREWKVEYQKSNEYLSNSPRVFQMRHDIFLSSKDQSDRRIIVDTKYKVREKDFKNDPKKGIAQNDLYQMVSYAVKRGCTEVLLLYPNISEEIHPPDTFEIISGFEGRESITVTAAEIPFWSFDDFSGLEDRMVAQIKNLLAPR